MADVVATLRGWSATESSNLPVGGTAIGANLDNNLREIQAVVRKYLASAATPMASATTVDLSTADGYYISITGTTTITGLGTESAGISYLLVFAGVLTFTHNSTSLILPGGANITTAVGDSALMISLGSGNWRCVNYQRHSLNEGGSKNLIINGGFTVNQRAYVSTTATAAGTYMHDRWKAGSGNGTYSFTQLAGNTTITISAGTIVQVIEDKNVQGTAYVLSWTGTATARYAVDSATPSGSYAASPILITGQTAGTTMSVEFSTGTLGNVQLERGTGATAFEQRPYPVELALCQRYYYRANGAAATEPLAVGFVDSTTTMYGMTQFPVTMRASPTALEQSGTAADYQIRHRDGTSTNCSSLTTIAKASKNCAYCVYTVASGLTVGDGAIARATGTAAYLGFASEL